jgi:alpha,alpha-trehalase
MPRAPMAQPPPPSPARSPARSPFPPIAEYGFLSDCHTGALVAADGTVEWLCLPRFDSASVFGLVLDRGAGGFRVGPYGVEVPSSRRYIPGTNILETTWMAKGGWIVVRDALTVGDWHDEENDGESDHARPPTDWDADHLLVRTIECLEGEVQIEVVCEPRFAYGQNPAEWSTPDGDWYAADATGGDVTLRLLSDLRLGIEGDRVRARHNIKAGEKRFCTLSWTHALGGPRTAAQADEYMDRTEHFWRQWLSTGEFPDHPHRTRLQRSALTLKGLTYAPTGATVAALTTSLPETPGGERNWDYRYTWMRDATFTLWSLHALGFDWEADDFMQFIADVPRGEDGALQIMYGIGGERDLTESELDLTGYDGSQPVRIGNGAFDQRQNDVFGAVLDSVYLHVKHSGYLPTRLWPVLQAQAEGAMRVWRDPDQGIWEARGAPQHYTSSKLMCWVAMDRAARLAEIRGEPKLGQQWQDVADEIRADILEHALDDRGVFVQHYDTKALDASVLLMPLVRFLPADDERMRTTILAVADELTEDGFVLRYRTEETDDGLSGEEGTFLICSFWLVSALSEIGEHERATILLDRLLYRASPLGLYAEELEAHTARHLGNFPQAFTHLALINAVMHIIGDEERRDG